MAAGFVTGRGCKATSMRLKDPSVQRDEPPLSDEDTPKSKGRNLDKHGLLGKRDEEQGGSILFCLLAHVCQGTSQGTNACFNSEGAKLVIPSIRRSGNFDKSIDALPKMTPPWC